MTEKIVSYSNHQSLSAHPVVCTSDEIQALTRLLGQHQELEKVEIAMRMGWSCPHTQVVLEAALSEGAIAYDDFTEIYSLATPQQKRLTELEARISHGLKAFIDVGGALVEIRESKLYKELGYSRFEDYVETRWGMKRRHAYEIRKAAGVIANLKNVRNCAQNLLPQNECQARPLTRIKPEEQQEVWAEAVRTAPNGKITGSHVERTVKKHRQQKLEKAREPQDQPQHQVGDLVVIECNNCTANRQQKAHTGCVAFVVSIGDSGGTIEVETKGERVRYMADETKPVENPAAKFKEAIALLNELYKREDLDDADRHALDYYWQNYGLSDCHLERMSHIWEQYHTDKGKPENIRARAAEHFTLESDRQ